MAKGNGHARPQSSGNGSLWLRRSYNFIDKDPAIDMLRTAFQDERRTSILKKESDLAALAGVVPETVKRMFGGETKRPRHDTLAKIASAIDREWVLQEKTKKTNYETELPKAHEQRKAHYAFLRARRERAEKRASAKK